MKEINIELTPDELLKIKKQNWGEHIFGKACSEIDHLKVWYQVPVGKKIIDYWVKNEKRNGKSKGRPVEITTSSKKKKKEKSDQKKAMDESGTPGTVLFRENLIKIKSGLIKKGVKVD